MSVPSVVVHQLPVRTTFRGETNIAENFHVEPLATSSSTREAAVLVPQQTAQLTDESLLVAHFRGRKLIGKKVVCPPGWSGCVALLPVAGDTSMPNNSEEGNRKRYRGEEEQDPDTWSSAAGGASSSNRVGGSTKDCVRDFEVVGQFDEYTTWEHDRPPAAQDHQNLLAWLDIASALHGC